MKAITIRFAVGSAVLLLVDILWVTSSELTEYLYHEKKFNKPFFTAYSKSVMFLVYILGFFFCDSWWTSYKSLSLSRLPDYYSSIADTDQQNLTMDDEEEEDEEEDSGDREILTTDANEFSEVNLNQPNVSVNCNIDDIEPVKEVVAPSPFIGHSIWVPIKPYSDTSSQSGKSETDDDENISVEGDVTIESLSVPSSRPTDTPISDDHKMLLIGSSNVNFKKKNKRSKRKSKKTEEANPEDSPGKAIDKPRRNVRFSKLIEIRTLTDKHAEDAYVSRLSYSAFMRHIYHKTQQGLNASNGHGNASPNSSTPDFVYRGPKLNVKETALLAFYFTPIWFAANLSFHVGLQYSEAGMVNVLSSTTPLFTLLLGIIFPSGSTTDSISLTKLLGVLVFIASVALISTAQPINHSSDIAAVILPEASQIKFQLLSDTTMPLGSIWSLVGAFFYAVYIVLMRFNVVHDAMLNFPMFFGFIGLFSLILMWPIILLLNFTQLEIFDWPSKEQWLLILVNGLCGTVISELLWLWGSFMTSSLVGTIAVSFTIPMAISFDVFFKSIEYPRLWATIPMFFSFILIILVSQYDNWDPILASLEKCVQYIGGNSNQPVGYQAAADSDANETIATTDHSMTPRHSLTVQASPSSSSCPASSSTGESNSSSRPTTSVQGTKPTVANNRRFDNKNYRPLKRSDNLANLATTSLSSRLFNSDEDDDQEQCQSLIEAEDTAYA